MTPFFPTLLPLLTLPVMLLAAPLVPKVEEKKAQLAQGGPLPPIQQPMEQATVHACQATEAMRRGDWKQARTHWELLAKLQPDRPPSLPT